MVLRFSIRASTALLSVPSMARSSSSESAEKFIPAGMIGGGGGTNTGGIRKNGGGGGLVGAPRGPPLLAPAPCAPASFAPP